MTDVRAFHYKPDGETLRQFMLSAAFVRGIRGPVGSGKSGACCVELFRRGAGQAPQRDGVRRTRFAVIRNTGPQLKLTTIKTWLDWFPEAVFGAFRWSPPLRHMIAIPLGDGTRMEMEVIFLALDSDDDVDTLYSLELTGAWVNEARFVPRKVVNTLTERVIRYPARKDGGQTWKGILLDTNAPSAEHWWAIMSGDKPAPEHWSETDKITMVKPKDWSFFKQPPGMLEVKDARGTVTGYEVNRGQDPDIPPAENLSNLDEDYYPLAIQGKSRSEIEVNILNRYGVSFEGKPVAPSFLAERHVAKEKLKALPDAPLFIGIDFGRTPAAIFGQLSLLRWRVLAELVTADMAAQQFARLLRAFLADRFPDHAAGQLKIFGDPAGDQRAQTRDETPFEILRAEGVVARPAPSNEPRVREEAVESVLNRADGMLIDASCGVLIAGMEGGYHFGKRGDAFTPEPVKNRYSHPCEALQYMLLGGGEGRMLTRGSSGQAQVAVAPRAFDVFNRAATRFGGRPSVWERRR